MQQQTLPSISTILLPRNNPFQVGNFAADATRELTKCANGELLSHDVVRDGIDALLQLKRAPYDAVTDIGSREASHAAQEREVLRTRPERGCFPPTVGRRWNDHGVKDDCSSDGEEHEAGKGEGEVCRASTPDHHRNRHRHANRVTNRPKKEPSSANRPPTIWHHRKSEAAREPASFPTPESPKSKASPDASSEAEDEVTAPAVLHFSCLQCHKAKKRCNRTRPCSRCISRGIESECRYPDKHDPRSVLRACLRCWQTKKKCDRKQPSCGKCEKVGVKCVYRREIQENPEVYSAGSAI